MISTESLYLLRHCLVSQQLSVGDPDFATIAQQAATALSEVDAAITESESAE